MTSLAQSTGFTGANGISSGGRYIAGSIQAVPGVDGERGAYWTASGEFHMVSDLPGGADYSILADVSDNGIAVGASSYADGQFGPINQAIRWTPQGGIEPLGFLPGDDISFAVDISADGSVIAGRGRTGNWLWTESNGMTPAAPLGFELRSMTSNGQYMLGRENVIVDGQNQLHATIWSEATGTFELSRSEYPSNAILSRAVDASPDLSVIAGTISGLSLITTPYVWFDQGTRGMKLEEYLLSFGLDVSATDYTLIDLNAMSDDGTRFLVNTFNPNGDPEAVLIIVPAPGTIGVLGVAFLAARRRR